jgi:hypothetical protein
MAAPGRKFIVFNAAAALIGMAALIAAVHSILVSPTAAPCSERYHNMTAFALDRAGVTLTVTDLQASLGGMDVGVVENVTIGSRSGAPTPLIMAVILQKASRQSETRPRGGGTTFPWQPHVLQRKASACLSYHVLLPADFDFQRGGALPGISGAGAGAEGDNFVARLAWRPKGLGATLRVTENGVSRAQPAEREAFQFPRGRWVKLEQEIALNTPKKSDGILRLWVDGTLAIERTDMSYRAKPDVTISGVSVDVFYGSGPDDRQAGAANDTKIWLTPFEVRWQ